jgi:hypothetical protein
MASARAVVTHLLAIRAGRDRHCDRMDTVFDQHPEIIQALCGRHAAGCPSCSRD